MSKKAISEIADASIPKFLKMIKDIPLSEKNYIITNFKNRTKILEPVMEW